MAPTRNSKPDEQELTEAQWQCIEHLIAGKTKTSAAEAAGVARYTVSRWFQDAVFVAALNARRLEVQEANVERLRSLTERALAVLEGALDDPNPKVRLQAATQILQAAKLTELPSPSKLTRPDEVEAKWKEDAATRDLTQHVKSLSRPPNVPEPRTQLTPMTRQGPRRN